MASQHNNGKDNPLFKIFGGVIHSYTRAQAIEDGTLVDLMKGETLDVCRQHYKHPIACTAAVFDLMTRAVNNGLYMNSYAGILHDMLHMSRIYGAGMKDVSQVDFRTIIQGAGRQRYYDFKLVIGPGDNMEPVITVMLYNES